MTIFKCCACLKEPKLPSDLKCYAVQTLRKTRSTLSILPHLKYVFYNIILIYSDIYVLYSPKRFLRELFSFIRDGEQMGKLVLSKKTPKVSVLPHLHYVFYKMILLYEYI